MLCVKIGIDFTARILIAVKQFLYQMWIMIENLLRNGLLVYLLVPNLCVCV